MHRVPASWWLMSMNSFAASRSPILLRRIIAVFISSFLLLMILPMRSIICVIFPYCIAFHAFAILIETQHFSRAALLSEVSRSFKILRSFLYLHELSFYFKYKFHKLIEIRSFSLFRIFAKFSFLLSSRFISFVN